MAAMPEDIRDEIESAYRRDPTANLPRVTLSPDTCLHPLMRPEVSSVHHSLGSPVS